MVEVFRGATRRQALAGAGASAVAATLARPVRAAPPANLDRLILDTMQAFDQPGLALAIVEDGRPVLTRGYGVRRLGSSAAVDEATVFAIASNTKSMTAAALALLVGEGRIGWDDPVVRHLPSFRMYDPYVTQNMTVRDLLLHRSGLGLGQGDLMVWPQTTHTRAEVVAGLRHLRPERGFRSGYAYDNVLYIVAGEVIAAVSGTSFERFMAERLFDPLAMADTVTSPLPVETDNRAAPHARFSRPVRGVGPISVLHSTDSGLGTVAAAGGVRSSARDMAKWLAVQTNMGALPGGGRLWSEAAAREMWKGQVIMFQTPGPTPQAPDTPNFGLYGLGWMVEDYRGRRVVWHSGSLGGQTSLMVLIPSLKTGFAVLTNAEEGGVLRTLRNTLLDHYLGAGDRFDWLADSRGKLTAPADAPAGAAVARPANAAAPSLPPGRYTGVYRDPWYGTVTIQETPGGLTISFDKSPTMNGALEPWDGETFRTRFTDRNVENALVTFHLNGGRVERVSMRAASPEADFSYDYHHLDLRPEGRS